ncbi:asparaginase [Tessaracoccus terricola]
MSLAAAPVVAHVIRSGFLESVHHGLAVVTAPDGTVEFAVGDAATQVFPRSANKPIHAVAALRAGAEPSAEALAIGCASHMGASVHLNATRNALAAVGLDESALRNVPGLPGDGESAAGWIRAGGGPASITQGCSGNHALMLAGTVAGGWDAASYDHPEHPFQELVRRTTHELGGEPVTATGVDGCGVPVYAFAIAGLARTYGRIAGAEDGQLRRVADAMRANPELVAGKGRRSTQFMQRVPGLIAKSGADGVFAAGLADGRGVAVKIADGGDRAAGVVLAALLLRTGATTAEQLGDLTSEPVLGHGETVGSVVAAPHKFA